MVKVHTRVEWCPRRSDLIWRFLYSTSVLVEYIDPRHCIGMEYKESSTYEAARSASKRREKKVKLLVCMYTQTNSSLNSFLEKEGGREEKMTRERTDRMGII